MSLIRKHVAVLQAWACLALVFQSIKLRPRHEFRLYENRWHWSAGE